jgi:hypothetical protein
MDKQNPFFSTLILHFFYRAEKQGNVSKTLDIYLKYVERRMYLYE